MLLNKEGDSTFMQYTLDFLNAVNLCRYQQFYIWVVFLQSGLAGLFIYNCYISTTIKFKNCMIAHQAILASGFQHTVL